MLSLGSSVVTLLDAGEDIPGDRGSVTGSEGELILVLVLSSVLSMQTGEEEDRMSYSCEIQVR